MRRALLGIVILLCAYPGAVAQTSTPSNDVLGSHNLSASGTSPIKGGLDPCLFCHAPHSGIGVKNTPLWSQTLSTKQDYTLYNNKDFSKTMANTAVEPPLGGPSNLCLSCHDGTVAPGQTVPYGGIRMQGTMATQDVFVNTLQGSHPFSLQLPLVDASDLVPSLAQTGTTVDPLHEVQLVNGNVECTTCHNPHVQGVDTHSPTFLLRDSSSGQLCLSCHTADSRTVNGVTNPLVTWTTSIHATAGNSIGSTVVGTYSTVGSNACGSCHMPHNAGAGPRLLRTTSPATAGMDTSTQTCMNCHNGGSNISPAIPNVYAEFAKKGHPFPQGSNTHDAAEPTVLANNRHATCVDCHNAHASMQVLTNYQTPPTISITQAQIKGVNASDGVTVVNPAVNEYDNCLRCHGSSSGKPTTSAYGYIANYLYSVAGDPSNVIPQFATTATSSHPVMHTRSSGLAQPSLLSSMLALDGKTPVRTMGTQIYCTDCHNSDDNRKFGGTGPNGPHGSQYDHILERRYVFSQVGTSGPGTAVTNLNPYPDLTATCSGSGCASPYALCAKCHDLNNVVSDDPSSFPQHSRHVNVDGFSCSVCHTAHGDPSGTVRLVNFDLNVVAPYNGQPITYNTADKGCTLTCHNHNHQDSH